MTRMKYNTGTTGEFDPGFRLVHNFFPGPLEDPGRENYAEEIGAQIITGVRKFGADGFRYWTTDEPGNDQRCYCGWLNGREHYGTRAIIDKNGQQAYPLAKKP